MMSDPFDIQAATERDSERSDAQQQSRLANRADISWVMADARGRRTLWRLLEQAGIYRSSFGPTPEVTAFNEGQRNVGLRLMGDLIACAPDEFLTMQTENMHAR